MDNQVESEKILSLQALRGLAFLGIFFVHTRAPVSWATLGVSTFFCPFGLSPLLQKWEAGTALLA